MNKEVKLRWLIWRFSMLADAMEATVEGYCNYTVDDCARSIRWLLERANDKTLCNDDCKGMYYCELKKKHKGKHKELSSNLEWD
jgi:hypothetical protein